MTLRVLVADDELLARKRLMRLLAAVSDVEVVGECRDGREVVARVREGGVDVLLLDVQMPELSGLEAAGLLPEGERRPAIVLCTAYEQHALEAFGLGAVDYLVKPVEVSRLRRALERARMFLSPAEAKPREGELVTRLALPTRGGIVLVDPRRVRCATLEEDELVRVVTDDGVLLSDEPLVELHARLPAGVFERVHRRAIVNLERVRRLEPQATGGFLAHLDDGLVVEVSRQAARVLRRRFNC